MVSTAYHRLLATIAALGSLLALAVVVLLPSPAQAAVTCDPDYPASVATTTSIRVSPPVGRYGTRAVATVRVTSDAGEPGGVVVVSVAGESRTFDRLDDGVARVTLPRGLAAQETYLVGARYLGRGCYDESFDSTTYTVMRSTLRIVGLDARDIRRGGHPFVSGRIITSTGVAANGRVTVRIGTDGDIRARETVTLRGGRFAVRFDRVYETGRWVAQVIKAGSRNYTGDSDTTVFRVRGRR
jgi:hypothetical protein